jgi:hypothetical protein
LRFPFEKAPLPAGLLLVRRLFLIVGIGYLAIAPDRGKAPAAWLHAKAEAAHKTPAQIIRELVRKEPASA